MTGLIYLLIGLGIGYFLFQKFMIQRANYPELLRRGAIIVDVRSPQEYDNGHISGSFNIPLNIINQRAADLKARNIPVICVCASGMRSGNACSILKKHGIECYNGGNWSVLSKKI